MHNFKKIIATFCMIIILFVAAKSECADLTANYYITTDGITTEFFPAEDYPIVKDYLKVEGGYHISFLWLSDGKAVFGIKYTFPENPDITWCGAFFVASPESYDLLSTENWRDIQLIEHLTMPCLNYEADLQRQLNQSKK